MFCKGIDEKEDQVEQRRYPRLWVVSAIVFLFLSVSLLVVVFAPNPKLPDSKTPLASLADGAAVPEAVERRTARQILSLPIKREQGKQVAETLQKPTTALSGAGEQTSDADQFCHSEWHEFVAVTPEDWILQARGQSNVFDPRCMAVLEAMISDKSPLDTLLKCISQIDQEDRSGKPSRSCIEAALMARALVIESLFSGNVDFANQSEEVLLNRVMAGFLLQQQTPEKIGQLIQMTDAQIEKDADSYPANKARASLLFMQQASFNTGDQNLIDQALARCADLNPDDAEIQEAKIALPVLFGKPNEMRSRAEEFFSADPENPVALYFRAGSFWESGNVQEATATFERIVNSGTSNPRYKNTLDKIRLATPKEKGHFSVSMSINLLNE
jgi:hypothetical protein